MNKVIVSVLLMLLSNGLIQSVSCLPSEGGTSAAICGQNIQALGTCEGCTITYIVEQSICTLPPTSPPDTMGGLIISCPANCAVASPAFFGSTGHSSCGAYGSFVRTSCIAQAAESYTCAATDIQNACQSGAGGVNFTPATNNMGDDQCKKTISVNAESAANLQSANLYHSQKVAGLTFSYNSIDPYAGPLGMGWTHSYNLSIVPQSNGTLLLKESDGNNFYFTLANGIYSPTASSGDTTTIILNSDGSYTRTFRNGIIQTYNSSGNLVSIVDRNGKTTTLTYSGANLASITDSNARVITITSTSGNITSITDPAGGVYSLAYTGGLLTSITDPLGNAWKYTYDANGMMLTKTDPLGNGVSYTYDTTGRLLTSTDPQGKTRTMNYINNGTTAFTDKDGGVWTYTYDTTLLAKTSMTDPLYHYTQYTYDSNRNLESVIAPDRVSRKTYTYDANNNVTSVTSTLGNKTSYTYNSMNLITSVADPNGNVTSLTYDAKGNLINITDPIGTIRTFQHDSNGNVISATDPRGNSTTFAYDAQNNLMSVTDPAGNVTSFTYDAVGNRMSMADPLGNITQYAYNILNQMTQITDPQGNVTRFTYDYMGNVLNTTDANNNPTSYAYNYRGQVTQIVDALNNLTDLTYGATSCGGNCSGAEKLSALTDAVNNLTSYAYDLAGRLTKEIDPTGNNVTYTYDSKGNVTLKTKADGTYISYTYDYDNRLTQKYYSDGSYVNFQYDNNGNLTYAGNQLTIYNYAYDANNRITGVTEYYGRNIQYKYDAAGNRTQMTAPDGAIFTYSYDTSNRLTAINTSAGSYTFTYDTKGRRATLTYPSGLSAVYIYDQTDRLVSITHKAQSGAVIDTNVYQYDNVGNRTSMTDNSGTHAYLYDPTYQLAQALHPMIPAEGYIYDPTGNRITELHGNTTITDTTATGNRIQTRTGESYTYDLNGNLITRTTSLGTTTYAYDIENRLVKATIPNGTIAQYKYDPFGRRFEKDVTVSGNTTVTQNIYDGANILYQYAGTSTITNRYTQNLAIDDTLAIQTNGQTYYYLKDGLGTIDDLADVNGNIVQSYTYDAYGNIQSQTGLIVQPFTFTGREYDTETGLYFYRARMYDAEMGRFIQTDPLSFAGRDVNLMRYVQNNPVNWIDPLGLVLISPEEGQSIADAAKGWYGTPYLTGGKSKKGADCSGSVWGIYKDAGFPYGYSPSSLFSKNSRFKSVNDPQAGDIGLFPGHMVIYDPNAAKKCSCGAGSDSDVWSASRPGGNPFGPGNSDWYRGTVQWYRYDKP